MATATTTRKKYLVTAVFRDRADMERAFNRLEDRGYSRDEISVLMSNRIRNKYYHTPEDDDENEAGSLATEGMGVGGAIGTAVGATIAALAAIGTSLMLPGVGVVIAGPIAAALAGGGAGAVVGGGLGAAIGAAIPEDNSEAYREALRKGGVILGVHTANKKDANAIEKEFKNLNGEDVLTSSVS
jgi:hypothetical protein